MNRHRLLPLLLIPVLLAGCETINHQDREVLRAHDVPQGIYDKMLYGDPLSVEDIIALSQQAVPAGLIIHYIDETDTAYRLRKADVKQLRDSGVSEEVISYMLSTSAPDEPVVYRGAYPAPAAYPYPYYPYDYYYGGSYGGPVVIVGGAYHRGWGGGGWGHRR